MCGRWGWRLADLVFYAARPADRDWTDCLVALACFGVGVFMVVDRLLQRRKQPRRSDSLVGCVETSLHQVNHQIWLLKNVFWWYLLPLSAALGVSGSPCPVGMRATGTCQLIGWCVYVVVFVLLDWFIYWLNQAAVKKSLEPRKRNWKRCSPKPETQSQQPKQKI